MSGAWGQVGLVLAAVISVFGAVWTLKEQHRLAQQREEPRDAIDGFDRLTKHLESQYQHSQTQYEISQVQIRDLYSKIADLGHEVDRYRNESLAWQRQLRLAVGYVKMLLASLTAANIAHPSPPDGLDIQ